MQTFFFSCLSFLAPFCSLFLCSSFCLFIPCSLILVVASFNLLCLGFLLLCSLFLFPLSSLVLYHHLCFLCSRCDILIFSSVSTLFSVLVFPLLFFVLLYLIRVIFHLPSSRPLRLLPIFYSTFSTASLLGPTSGEKVTGKRRIISRATKSIRAGLHFSHIPFSWDFCKQVGRGESNNAITALSPRPPREGHPTETPAEGEKNLHHRSGEVRIGQGC